MADVVVSRRVADSIRRGHPWIYASAVGQISDRLRDLGTTSAFSIVSIADEDGNPIGSGIWDAASPLAVRVWTLNPAEKVDAALFRARLEAAIRIRARLFGNGDDAHSTTAYRLLNGEGDRTPGFVIDRYADVAVLRTDGDAARSLADELLSEIEAPLRAAGVTTLLDRTGGRGSEALKIHARFGSLTGKEKITVKEHGVPFLVDLAHGQKTGAFLDQRENRRRVGELVARRTANANASANANANVRVLNLFSYAGGFSLRAALAGAVVTSVDIAAQAHATAQESFRLAGVDPRAGGHTFASSDCFAFLERAKAKGEVWDVVICDPPSFAPSEKAKLKGMGAYRSLHRACIDVLAEGGTFVASSCSSHVTLEDFASTLDDASLGRSDLRVLEMFGLPADHPTLAVFPEGRYLKLAILE